MEMTGSEELATLRQLDTAHADYRAWLSANLGGRWALVRSGAVWALRTRDGELEIKYRKVGAPVWLAPTIVLRVIYDRGRDLYHVSAALYHGCDYQRARLHTSVYADNMVSPAVMLGWLTRPE